MDTPTPARRRFHPVDGSRRRGTPPPGWLVRAADLGWRVVAVAAAAAVLVWLLVEVRVVVLPMTFAVLLSSVLIPPQRWLRRHGIPELAATWLIFVVGLAVLAGIAVWLIPAIVGQAAGLADLGRHGLDRIQQWLVDGPLHLSASTAQQVFDRLRSGFSADPAALVHGALHGTVVAAEIVAGALLTAVFTFFVIKDGERAARSAILLAGPSRRHHLEEVGQRAWRVLSGYVLGTTLNGVVNGGLMALTLAIVGVPLVLPLAFLTFLGAYVPVAGAFISGGLAALVALAADGWTTALAVVVATIVIHHVEAYLVGPVVLGRAVRLQPAAVVAALAVGGTVAGLPGAMLAVPVAAVATTLVSYRRNVLEAAAAGTGPIAVGRLPAPPETGEASAWFG